MPRAEYKTIIAPKLTVSKIERFRNQRSLPSNSQALAVMASEMEASDSLIQILLQVIKQLLQAIKDLKRYTGKKYTEKVNELIELANTIIQAIHVSKSNIDQ